ncbi:MAG: TerC/Alx family metal homeostasis membrane protein [Bacteriovorax sp.]|nr:TerC/Alx family metal homeostasis membrane protein [Bacteriovorax sp.]
MNHFFSNISIVPSWLWISFTLGILILLLIDLSLFGLGNHKIQTKTALLESGIWIFIGLCFNAWFAFYFGSELGVEFLTGYLVEKSLSIDNLFIILLIFSSFRIPDSSQHRVLFYGVIGAIILRGVFILFGAHLLHTFHWVLYIFGLILIITAIKFLRETDEKIDVKENWSVRLLKRIIPTTDKTNGSHFFIKENGLIKATPLFLALVVIEVTDLVFAVDSIPAVFSVTRDAFVAFASNIFAILGLRALYFVLADWVGRLRYLKPGLAAILGFIGAKMLFVDFFKIPSWVSLLVIFSILTTAGLSSWYVARIEEKRKTKNGFI